MPENSKVFCIGFNKTGTSSLHALFERAGFRSYHGRAWRRMEADLLGRYDCFSDGIPDDFTELDRRYPRSRFILNVRDLDAWLGSRLDHVRREKAAGTWEERAGNWDDTNSAVRNWIARRNAHHRRVLDYFRGQPEKLLIVNYPRDLHAAEKIYAFLGLRSPPPERPRENVNIDGDSLARNRDRIDRLLEELGIPASERQCDILCPSLLAEHREDLYPADTSLLETGVWGR
jgi:hypothetical protein